MPHELRAKETLILVCSSHLGTPIVPQETESREVEPDPNLPELLADCLDQLESKLLWIIVKEII